jgi:GT2 family glycosyltransferase
MEAAGAGGSPDQRGIAQPVVSVVVTGYRQAPHAESCLRSLAAHRAETPFDVVVFLNEPAPEVQARLAEALPGSRVQSSEVNLGFAGAVNRAVAATSGEFVVLLNDDAVVEPGWLDALVAAARADERIGAVGSKVLGPDGAPLEDGTVLWSDGTVTLVDDFSVPRPAPAPGARRVDYASGVSLLVRRSSWDEVGGLDEGYFPAYYEDVDLCLKLEALGQMVLYEPASVVRHLQGASAPLPYRVFLRDRNAARLRARWPHALAARLAPAPHDPVVISRAVELAARRLPSPGEGPRLPDVAGDDSPRSAEHYLKLEQEVTGAYAAHLEAALGAARDAPLRQALVAAATRVKAVLRRSTPGPYRAVARWQRRLADRPRAGRGAG